LTDGQTAFSKTALSNSAVLFTRLFTAHSVPFSAPLTLLTVLSILTICLSECGALNTSKSSTGWLKKSKLLYCVNSLLFLSHPVCISHLRRGCIDGYYVISLYELVTPLTVSACETQTSVLTADALFLFVYLSSSSYSTFPSKFAVLLS